MTWRSSRRNLLVWIVILLALFSAAQAKSPVLDEQGRLKVSLDVAFRYRPSDADVTRWKQNFSAANRKLSLATNGWFYLDKVTFYICPETSAGRGSRSPASADVDIFDTDGTSFSPGRYYNSSRILLYENGQTDGDVVGHELMHYLFGLVDEYPLRSADSRALSRLQTVFSVTPRSGYPTADITQILMDAFSYSESGKTYIQSTQQEQDIIRQNQRFFDSGFYSKIDLRMYCSTPFFDIAGSCIMMGDQQPERTDGKVEYRKNLCGSEHVAAHYTVDNQSGIVVKTQTFQAKVHGESCQAIATKTTKSAYGRTIDLTQRKNVSLEPVEFEEKDGCEEVVVLLLDKSGSMYGSRMAYLKSAAARLIDSLDDDTKLGIVWFDSQPRAAVGIQKLGDSRHLAQQAIYGVTADGGTRIGFGLGVAYEQIRLFRDPEKPRSKETIFLVTDGESSDDVEPVLNVLAGDQVKVSTVALGEDTDAAGLFQMAARTGGESYFARSDEDISRSVVAGALKSLENYTILSDSPASAVTQPMTLDIDTYVDDVAIQLDLAEIIADQLEVENFSLVDNNGAAVPFSVRISNQTVSGATVAINFENIRPGRYVLSLPADALQPNSTAAALVLGQSSDLQWMAYMESGSNVVQYPEHAVLTATVLSNLGSAHDLPVTAVVTFPDGSKREVELFDDGSAVHGDDFANDGVYHVKLNGLNQNGTYTVLVTCDNSEAQAYAGAGQHSNFSGNPEKFATFRRQAQLSFEVQNFVAPEPSFVRVSPRETPLGSQILPLDLAAQAGVTVAGLRVQVGPGQGARLTKLGLSAEGTEQDLSTFTAFDVFIDGDHDGIPDGVGPTASPVSSNEAIWNGEALVLRDILELPGDSDVDILIVGRYSPAISSSEQLAAAAWVLIPLGALALLSGRRRRLWVAGCLLLVVIGLGSGCGTSESYIFTGDSHASKETREERREFRASIDLGTVEAVGLADGQPIAVEVVGAREIPGPQVEIVETVPASP